MINYLSVQPDPLSRTKKSTYIFAAEVSAGAGVETESTASVGVVTVAVESVASVLSVFELHAARDTTATAARMVKIFFILGLNFFNERKNNHD